MTDMTSPRSSARILPVLILASTVAGCGRAAAPAPVPPARETALPRPIAASGAAVSGPGLPTPEELQRQARDLREQVVAALTSSGAGGGPNLALDRLVAEWKRTRSGRRMTVGPISCFRRGCYFEARHHSAKTVEDMLAWMQASDQFQRWRGGKVMGPPIEGGGGESVVTWAFFNTGEPLPDIRPLALAGP
jgi:hypothetical protein